MFSKNKNFIVRSCQVQIEVVGFTHPLFHLSFNVLGVNRGPTDNQSMNSEV